MLFTRFHIIILIAIVFASTDVSNALSTIQLPRTSQKATRMSLYTGDFSSKSNKGLYLPQWGVNNMRMADPDAPPEVDPTRRDPNDPEPFVPVRLPVVDFGTFNIYSAIFLILFYCVLFL